MIRFDDEAVIDPLCDMTPVRMIDPDQVGDRRPGGQTDITAALELALMRLEPYMQALQQHPERAEHPLPLVLLFSDGEHNVGSGPQPVADEIKSLNLDGEPVVIAVAGVSVGSEPARRKDAPRDRLAGLLRPHHQRPGAGGVHQLGGQFGRLAGQRRRRPRYRSSRSQG